MAAGEGTERGQHQVMAARIKGEAGQPQSIAAATEAHHWMEMAADVEQAGVGIGTMAEPQGTDRLGWLLGQPFMPLAAVMVAGDQPQRTAQQGWQCRQFLPQALGEAKTIMDQIAEHHHLFRPPSMREL